MRNLQKKNLSTEQTDKNASYWMRNRTVLTMASHRAVCSLYVAAMMGTVGLSLDILRAVLPLVVNATIAADLDMSAT